MKTAHRRNPLLPKHEHKSEPLAPSSVYIKRILINLAWANIVLFVSLWIGILIAPVAHRFLHKMNLED